MGVVRLMRSCRGVSGRAWASLGVFCRIRMCLGLSGRVWACVGVSGCAQRHLMIHLKADQATLQHNKGGPQLVTTKLG